MSRHQWQKLLAGICALATGITLAQDGGGDIPESGQGNNSLICKDSGFYSQMKSVSDLCWECFFPIRVAGINATGSGRGRSRLPAQPASPVCVCPGRMYGMPSPGITWGMWFPTHVMEVVRQPWCSPTLFGEVLSGSSGFDITKLRLMGSSSNPAGAQGNEAVVGSFYNWHWMTFPVYEVMEQFMSSLCSPGGWGGDMSFLYFSEFDPTWSNEMLALFTHPEIKVFANLYARAVCMADAVASTVSRPMDSAIWCAGAWGMIYPFSGVDNVKSAVEAQMLAGVRGLAAMHRRGLAKRTYGNKAVCSDSFWFMYPKQQYQFQNFWPYPQRRNNNWTGASSIRWGEWRKIPVQAEDRVIMQWTYKECCYTFY